MNTETKLNLIIVLLSVTAAVLLFVFILKYSQSNKLNGNINSLSEENNNNIIILKQVEDSVKNLLIELDSIRNENTILYQAIENNHSKIKSLNNNYYLKNSQ
ncbi:MAG TPA: hypothetical protein VIL99_09440 [Ignavibacteria bacterium]